LIIGARTLVRGQKLPSDLWLPEGVTRGVSTLGGYNLETASPIALHAFHFHDVQSGRRSKCTILQDDDTSQAQVEDMAGNAFESWLFDIRTDGKKRAPTLSERKQIGQALEEFRRYAQKRRQSSNSRIYYQM
jgi:uncharacterized protein YifE (UPF0438 family)